MMRKISLLFLLSVVIFLANCVKIDEIEDAKSKSELILKNFIQAVIYKDSHSAAKLFAGSEDAVLILPSTDSLIVGKTQIEKTLQNVFQQFEQVEIKRRELKIFPSIDLNHSRAAGIYGIKIKKNDQHASFQCYVSAFLGKYAGIWQLEQLHVSLIGEKLHKNSAQPEVPVTLPENQPAMPDSVAQLDSTKAIPADSTKTDY